MVEYSVGASYSSRHDLRGLLCSRYSESRRSGGGTHVSLVYPRSLEIILTYDGEVNRYKVVHPRKDPVQLFDIVSDPHETQNLADQYPEVAARLKERIEDWYPLTQRKLVSGK